MFFTNDLYSYQKEIEFEGEVHNLVLVLENFLDLDRWTARDHVARLRHPLLGEQPAPKLRVRFAHGMSYQ